MNVNGFFAVLSYGRDVAWLVWTFTFKKLQEGCTK